MSKLPAHARTRMAALVALSTLTLSASLAGCTGDRSDTQEEAMTDQANSELVSALDSTLDDVLTDAGDQGVQAVLLADGETIWSAQRGHAISNVHPSREVDDATLFNLGSFGKLVLGSFALSQVEKKVLDLDTPISAYVGDEIAGSDEVTIRMLLSHTSGYGNVYADPSVVPLFPPGTEGAPIGTAPIQYNPNRPFTFEQLNAGIKAPVDPGSTYEYQDTNYIVLLELLKTVLGGEKEVTDEISVFLEGASASDPDTGAEMTSDREAPTTLENFAHGYEPLDNDLGLQDYNTAYGAAGVPTDEFGFPFGDGFFAGNALGAASFLDSLFTQQDVLAPATIDVMTTPTAQSVAAEETMGLATSRIEIDASSWQGHGGYFGGFTSASYTEMEQGVTLVVLTNRASPSPTVAAAIWEALAAKYVAVSGG